ncbi:glycosyltransferase [Ornithinimicrobium sp. LYQ121]|uniref:glycosyltransferase n=1 Tax=Ornithinimicrobium sp. LYQ121 TaxID=3378801 RepID=UPI00385382B1
MIGYYVHHHGSGHTRRATAVARRLTRPVVGLGSGGRPEGWPGEWVDLASDDVPPVPDSALADVTAGDTLHWVPRHHPGLQARHRQLVDWIGDTSPDLMVVDVSVEVTLQARLCGIPVVVAAMPGERTDRSHIIAYDLAEALLAPWPAGAHPDGGWPSHWWDKVWHVGGISALDPPPVEPSANLDDAPASTTPEARRVLVLWGGGGDDLPAAALEEARRATPGWTWEVRGGGHPTSPDLWADLLAADVVVCHAGQGSVADVALARRPAVVLAQPRPYDEQAATARALGRMGLAATGLGWPAAHEWVGLLSRALTLGGDGWAVWGGDGAARAADLLERLAERVGPTGRERR